MALPCRSLAGSTFDDGGRGRFSSRPNSPRRSPLDGGVLEEGRRKSPRPQMNVVAGTDSGNGLRVRRGNSGRLRTASPIPRTERVPRRRP
jgi:hypothetical protein